MYRWKSCLTFIKRYFIIGLISFLYIFFSAESELIAAEKNHVIIDSIAQNAAESLISYVKSGIKDSVYFAIAECPAQRYFYQKLIDYSGKNNILVSANSSQNISIDLLIEKFGVTYSNLDSDRDLIVRKFECKITGFLKSGSSITPIKSFEENRIDTVFRDELPFLESNMYPFAKSEIPQPPKSFFHQIAEPAIIITSALLTVILLFTLRSE